MLEGMSRDVMEILCQELALDAAQVLAMLEHDPDAHITSAGEACPAQLATADAHSATNTEPPPERMTDKDEAAPRLAGGVGADVFRVYRVTTAARARLNPKVALRIAWSWPGVTSPVLVLPGVCLQPPLCAAAVLTSCLRCASTCAPRTRPRQG